MKDLNKENIFALALFALVITGIYLATWYVFIKQIKDTVQF